MYWTCWFFHSVIFPGGDAQASLTDVLAFVTGAERPPILGFDTIPTIVFHQETFPTANTCAIILRLPTTHDEYEEFKSKMDFAILNSPCFGQTWLVSVIRDFQCVKRLLFQGRKWILWCSTLPVLERCMLCLTLIICITYFIFFKILSKHLVWLTDWMYA